MKSGGTEPALTLLELPSPFILTVESEREGDAVEIRLLGGMMSGHCFHPVFNTCPGIGTDSEIYIFADEAQMCLRNNVVLSLSLSLLQ